MNGRKEKQAWDAYLIDRDASALLAFIRAAPPVSQPCVHSYPDVHRIKDVNLCGHWYRVGRCARCDERLFFTPTDVPSLVEGGAMWLSREGAAALGK
jgi:hypothetical protein